MVEISSNESDMNNVEPLFVKLTAPNLLNNENTEEDLCMPKTGCDAPLLWNERERAKTWESILEPKEQFRLQRALKRLHDEHSPILIIGQHLY